MKTYLRLLALMCAVLLLLCSVTACDDAKEPDQTTDGTTTATTPADTTPGETTTITETTEDKKAKQEAFEREAYAPEQVDYNGYIYRMLTSLNADIKWWGPKMGGDGDVIDLALFNRNAYLQEFFNIEIIVKNHDKSLSSDLALKDAAGDHYADVLLDVAMLTMRTAVKNGYALNLANVEEFNLEASYWDQRIQQEYQIEGMIFALEGDFTCYDELCTFGVLYNDELYTEYGYYTKYGSPYEMVRKGNWTLDTMLAMIKDRSDIKNVQQMTKDNQWGMITENQFPWVVFMGTGLKAIEVQRDGSFELLFSDDTKYEEALLALDYITRSILPNEEILFANSSKGVLDDANPWPEASQMFESGKALFRATTLVQAVALDNMEANFGILPIPKYTSKQKEYHSYCLHSSHSPIIIPATALPTFSMTASITEAIGYTSKYMPTDQLTMEEAFYENMAVLKLCRTEEDYKMLELIYANKTYDIDTVLAITGLESSIYGITTSRNPEGLAHTMGGLQRASERRLTQVIGNIIEKVKN